MSLPDLTQIPWWYYLVAALFSAYYAWRGGLANYRVATGQKEDYENDENKKDDDKKDNRNENKIVLPIFKYFSKKQIFLIYSLHDIISHLICSLSGFLSLYILSQCHLIKSTEDSIFIIFLSLYSVVGITDLLPQLLPLGKFPGR